MPTYASLSTAKAIEIFLPSAALVVLSMFCCMPSKALGQSIGGAILLKNDRMMEGQVLPSGEFYTVQVAEQSRVSVPKNQVLHVGQNKQEIYQFKAGSIKRWEAGDHFQMTRWCMLNGLYSQATRHYREVASSHGDHPRVRQLALELRDRLLEIPEFRDYLGINTVETERSVSDTQNLAVDSGNPVVAASASVSAAAMHPQIAAHFSRRIQPILLQRCSQPACHGAQSSNGLRITEPYRAAYQQVTAENLHSVLSQVSTDENDLSALLRYATTAHGIQRKAGISITETQLLTEITNWIQFVQNPVASAVAEGNLATPTPGAVSARPLSGFRPYSPATVLVPVQPGESGLRPVPKMFDGMRSEDFPGGDVPLASEIEALDRQLSQILGEAPPEVTTGVPAAHSGYRAGAAPAASQPRSADPFDPAEFNRRSQVQGNSGR